MAKGLKYYFNKWHNFFEFMTHKVALVLFIALLPFLIYLFYHIYFVNGSYCVKDQDKFNHSFKQSIAKKSINKINTIDLYLAFYREEKLANSDFNYIVFALRACPQMSSNGLLDLKDVKLGDSIYKDANSNEFTVLRRGEKYVFSIDPNRDIDGNLIEE